MVRSGLGRGIVVVALLLAAQTSAVGEPDYARELVQQADAATRALRSASYTATLEAIGGVKGRLAEWAGEVKFKRVSAGNPLGAKVRLAGRLQNPGAQPRDQVMTFDGAVIREFFPAESVLLQGDLTTMGAKVLASYRLLLWMALRQPFWDELEGSLELAGQKRVGEVACRAVRVVYKDGSNALMHIGIEDKLPRRFSKTVEIDGHSGTYVFTITKIDRRTAIGDQEFVLTAPAGSSTENYPPLSDQSDQTPTTPDYVSDVYKSAMLYPLRFDSFVAENAGNLKTPQFTKDLESAHKRVTEQWKYHEDRSSTTPGPFGPTHNEHYYEADGLVKVKWLLEAIYAVVFKRAKFCDTMSGGAACLGVRYVGEEAFANLARKTMNGHPWNLLRRQ